VARYEDLKIAVYRCTLCGNFEDFDFGNGDMARGEAMQ
jgi:hypothetical protein